MKKNINDLLEFKCEFDLRDDKGVLCFKRGNIYKPTNMVRVQEQVPFDTDTSTITLGTVLKVTFISEGKRRHSVSSQEGGWLSQFKLV